MFAIVYSFWICPGNVRWCPSLALGNLFKATSSNPQSVAVSFRPGWSSLFRCASFPSAQGPGVVYLMSQSTASTTCPYLLRGPLVQLGGWIPWFAPEKSCSVFKEDDGSVFPTLLTSPLHVLVCPRLFPKMYSFWWISYPFPMRGQCVKVSALSCLALTATLYMSWGLVGLWTLLAAPVSNLSVLLVLVDQGPRKQLSL